MTRPINERQALWDDFLTRWPLETLGEMTLPQYATAGDKDCFVYWLETATEDLGSIWGGSAFKFGIYSRKNQVDKTSKRPIHYDAQYAWAAKYGETRETAFTAVRDIIVEVASAARAGNLAAVEDADLGNATKWKIAFLYQDRVQPSIVPVFSRESLETLFGPRKPGTPHKTCAQMQAALAAERGERALLAYGDELWARVETVESAKLTSEQALALLQDSDRFKATMAPAQKIAGFRNSDGLELALIRETATPTFFLTPGDWLKPARGYLVSDPVLYTADRERNSGLATHAPSLALGHPAASVKVASRADLLKLLDAYDDPEGSSATDSPVPPLPMPSALTMPKPPLNQIFFGPPGTGKTYTTVDAALKVLDPTFLAAHVGDRVALKARFDALVKDRRVRFVTFHQSFSYEDFVEGIRATTETDDEATSGAIRYRVEKGVFAELCQDAKRNRQLEAKIGVRSAARVWKISIKDANASDHTRQYCLTHGEARIGWAEAGDLRNANLADPALKLGPKDQASLLNFAHEIAVGDVVVCLSSTSSICAVGVVSGDYEYAAQVPQGVRSDYVHRRPVHWLTTGIDFNILPLNKGVQLTQQTVYPLSRVDWPDLLQALKAEGVTLADVPTTLDPTPEPYVLIIDEINRGNVSRIFGELITLIEPSKRAGADEGLEVVLPYSRQPFSVPANVYLIGTMNTADRSLAGLDVALRRRFVFREMPPRPDLLDAVTVAGISVGQLLRTLNQRIEALLDRDHCLGHANFMALRAEPKIELLAAIFRNQVLPLLQEYFFEDWQRIQWVLNDHRKPAKAFQFVQARPQDTASLFGDDVNVSRSRQAWLINDIAFDHPESYLGVMDHTAAA
ncbi:AAA family ATPase [Ideonella sp. YS5]|uniref:AAA family ATPase n=1 Tax=Ideonella sp. YS5 TaxID=3453714 RepID=UPI003EE93AFB